jgi:hypothetical protein
MHIGVHVFYWSFQIDFLQRQALDHDLQIIVNSVHFIEVKL